MSGETDGSMCGGGGGRTSCGLLMPPAVNRTFLDQGSDLLPLLSWIGKAPAHTAPFVTPYVPHIASLSIVLAASYLYIRWRKAAKKLPPGTFGWPFIGESIEFLYHANTGKFFKDRSERYGPIYRTHLFGTPTVMLPGASNVKKILKGEGTQVETLWPPSFKAVMGHGALCNMDPHSHKLYRKVVMRSFRPDHLMAVLPTIQQVVVEGLKDWDCYTSVLVYDRLREITFRSSVCAFIGLDPGSVGRLIDEMAQDFNQLSKGMFNLPFKMPVFNGFAKAMEARDRLHRRLSTLLSEDPSERGLPSILAALVDGCAADNLPLPVDRLAAMMTELLLGGQETSTSALTCAIMLLGQNENLPYLDRLRAELSEFEVLEPGSPLSLRLLEDMPYLNYVMKEVLRLYPPIAGGFRKLLQPMKADGYQIPAGWNVTYSIKDLHENSPLFPDATKFNPDRWSNLKEPSSRECLYVPFGTGHRSCVGKEYGRLFFRVFLIEVVRSFNWKLVNKGIPNFLSIPTLVPTDRLPVKFSRRD